MHPLLTVHARTPLPPRLMRISGEGLVSKASVLDSFTSSLGFLALSACALHIFDASVDHHVSKASSACLFAMVRDSQCAPGPREMKAFDGPCPGTFVASPPAGVELLRRDWLSLLHFCEQT